MNRILSVILSLALVLSLTACSTTEETKQNNILTISFEYGDRAGSYNGDTDENGLPHGYGSFTSEKPDGTSWTYTGEWDHGHWNGQGQTVWSTGESYSGYYSNDEINGYGVFTASDGIVVVGNFANRIPTGYCSVYLNGDYDGYVFWGNFVNGNSDGTVYTPLGDTIPATYKNGKIQFIPESTVDFTTNDIAQEEPTDVTTAPTSEEAVPTAEITSGMLNALRAAENYLSIMPFSYTGLIEQLEYEEFTHEEAIYAADNCGADWYEQAAKDAKNYLDLMPFSRGSLIDQLEYEGYTAEQAAYAADQNGL